MTGGKFIAIERGLHEAEEREEPEVEPAMAPLIETATAHMIPERLAAFLRWYGDLP